MIIYLISAVVFVAIFLFVFGVLYFVSRRKDPLRLRLKNLREGEEVKDKEAKKSLTLLTDTEQAKGTRIWLAQAGYRGPSSVSNYYGTKFLLAIIVGALGVLVSFYLYPQSTEIIALAGFFGLLIGAYLPTFWVSEKIRRRAVEIRLSVSSMLDLLVVCVEAGLSLNASFQRIADDTKNTHPILSQELQLVNKEILVGKSRADALRSLARRTGVEELRSLAVMLIQADKLGVSIADSLRVLADSLRIKRMQRAQEAAHKVSVKLVFPLVLLIFPELLVIVLGPAAISILKTLSEISK